MWNQMAASALRCSSLVCHFIYGDGAAQGASLHRIKRGQIIPESSGGGRVERRGRTDRWMDRQTERETDKQEG